MSTNTAKNQHEIGFLLLGTYTYLSYLIWVVFLGLVIFMLLLTMIFGGDLRTVIYAPLVSWMHTFVIYSGPGFALYILMIRMAEAAGNMSKSNADWSVKVLLAGHIVNAVTVILFSLATFFGPMPFVQGSLLVLVASTFILTTIWENLNNM